MLLWPHLWPGALDTRYLLGNWASGVDWALIHVGRAEKIKIGVCDSCTLMKCPVQTFGYAFRMEI